MRVEVAMVKSLPPGIAWMGFRKKRVSFYRADFVEDAATEAGD